MKLTADLHIHSHYSRATSKNLDFPRLSKRGRLKGADIVGAGAVMVCSAAEESPAEEQT